MSTRSIAALVCLLVPATTLAEERPFPTDNMLELGLYSGAFIPSKNHELYESLESFQSPLGSLGLSISLRAAYFPLAWLGAELEGGLMPQKNERGDSVNLFTVRAHGVVQFPWRVTPFGLVGAGYLGARGPSSNDVDRALHWGAGLKFYPVEWMSLRFEGRQIWTAARGPGEGNTSHFEVLGGLTFTLWREDGEEEPHVEFGVDPIAEAPAPRPEPEEVVEVSRALVQPAREVVEELGTVHFAWGSAKLESSSFSALDRAAKLLDQHLELKVQIAGHADSTGPEAFNLKLSKRRARSVVGYLVEKGVAEDRLTVRAFGEWSPIAPNETKEGRAKNRRCEIRVVDENGDELASNPTDDE